MFFSSGCRVRSELTMFGLFCRVEEAAASEPKPLFQVIRALINKLPNGQQVMEEVPQITYTIITKCLGQICYYYFQDYSSICIHASY